MHKRLSRVKQDIYLTAWTICIQLSMPNGNIIICHHMVYIIIICNMIYLYLHHWKNYGCKRCKNAPWMSKVSLFRNCPKFPWSEIQHGQLYMFWLAQCVLFRNHNLVDEIITLEDFSHLEPSIQSLLIIRWTFFLKFIMSPLQTKGDILF